MVRRNRVGPRVVDNTGLQDAAAAVADANDERPAPAKRVAEPNARVDQFDKPHTARPRRAPATQGAPQAVEAETHGDDRIRPAWVGDVRAAITHNDKQTPWPMGGSFLFDSLARQRATKTKLTFEVWAPGHTDRRNPNLWKELDVRIHYRYGDTDDFKTDHVWTEGRSGNNMRYQLNLRSYDPWDYTHPRPDVPTSPSADGRHKEAKMQFYFTVNGEKLTPDDAPYFQGTYQIHADN